MAGLTLDTGALIALERNDRRLVALVEGGRARGPVIVPAVVLAEWWCGQPRARAILEGLIVEPVSERIAKLAGEARRAVGRASAVDAIVMASAAQRGDVVVTSDLPDLDALREFFPTVRLMRA